MHIYIYSFTYILANYKHLYFYLYLIYYIEIISMHFYIFYYSFYLFIIFIVPFPRIYQHGEGRNACWLGFLLDPQG